jgi:putative glycosyltransferase (TIGR04372 family)
MLWPTRQLKQISEEGWPAVRRKLKSLIYLILGTPLVILIRIIRPLVVIRLIPLDIGRIGGSYHADWYLSEKAAGKHRGRYLDLFFFIRSTDHINKQWLRMWKRVLLIFPLDKLAEAVEKINRKIPGYEHHLISNDGVLPTRDEHIAYVSGRESNIYAKYNERLTCILTSEKPNLYLTNKEEMLGKRDLKKIGVPEGKPFICFHARDSAFLDKVRPDHYWKYHDFRDSSIRNYLKAAEEMTERGCYAIRNGAIVKEKIDVVNPKVIDYSCNGMRTDFLDIFLSAKCRFFLCSDTGMSFPAEVFKKPMVFVNWTMPLRTPVYVKYGLVIFKKFYLMNENRYLSFSEIINLDLNGTNTNEMFANLNLELHENTPDEIRAVTIEMDERLNGTWQTTEEDEELQQRFWSIFGPNKLKTPDLRIGSVYLQMNRKLLD